MRFGGCACLGMRTRRLGRFQTPQRRIRAADPTERAKSRRIERCFRFCVSSANDGGNHVVEERGKGESEATCGSGEVSYFIRYLYLQVRKREREKGELLRHQRHKRTMI